MRAQTQHQPENAHLLERTLMSDQNAATQPKGEQPSTRFSIQKIYVKDVSFEAPSAPDVFTHQVNPRINMQLGNSAKALAQNVHEVVLSLTVTATHEEKTTFLIEVQQAGIFGIEGYTDQQLQSLLGSYCPNILFPFAREVVADLASKGGFPPLLLAPINFEALYAQHLQGQKPSAPGDGSVQ